MQYTSKYSLSQWDKSDRIQMQDFNADNLKIEQAIEAVDVAQLALAAVTAQKGNCSMTVQGYTGTGSGGFSVTFPRLPDFFIIFGSIDSFLGSAQARSRLWYAGRSTTNGANYGELNVTWSGSTLRVPELLIGSAPMGNRANTPYQVVAFFREDAE